MLRLSYLLAWFVTAMLAAVSPFAYAVGPLNSVEVPLRDGWQIQSSRSVGGDSGEVISTTEYKPNNWYPASVPTTIFAALVADKVYANPFFGMNLRLAPGVTYPIGDIFSNTMMPPGSPFACAWWYRTDVNIPVESHGKRLWLQFDGINFRANIWLNGHQIATTEQVAGTFRSYEFDITDVARAGGINALAVEVFPPRPHDLQLNWVDVNPAPPDKDMGIWRPVRIVASGPISVRYPDVISHLEVPAMDHAQLELTAELRNATGEPVKGILSVTIEGVQVKDPVELEAHQERKVVLTASNFPQLILSHPRVWWPIHMGKQNLYTAKFEFVANGEVSDDQTVSFGIRNVTTELTPGGALLYRVNGQKVLLRGGGGWGDPDMLLRSSPERQEWQVRYAVDLGLNAIRMDGKFEDQHFLDLVDRAGIMLLPGWCCCDHWERWSQWSSKDDAISAESLRDIIRGFRTHPSVITWLNGDDNPPPPEVEKRYLAILKENNWPNPSQSSATGKATTVSGPTGYKMTGPYMWVPPSYWYIDHKHGGAFGLNTETSPTESIPPVESILKMLPKSHLWPVDEFWDYHGGGGLFVGGKDVQSFTKALNARYGQASDLQDYAVKAQLMSYAAERAMFEAFGRNKYVATGVLQEMMNSAWPSFICNFYDYYLRPGGAYFGAKKALEPLHIQYSYDDRSIVVVNSLYKNFKGVRITAEVYDLHLRRKFEERKVLDIASDNSVRAFTIPEIRGLTSTYFVRCELTGTDGKKVSPNFYWLSTKPDELDLDKTTWMYTPTIAFADFTALRTLPQTSIHAQATIEHGKDGLDVVHVDIDNPSKNLAFFLRLTVANGQSGEEILPVLWQDNYISLMPGETRTLTATFSHQDLGNAPVKLEVSGWNVLKSSYAVQ